MVTNFCRERVEGVGFLQSSGVLMIQRERGCTGIGRCLDSVGHGDFIEDVAHVGGNRPGADEQLLANLLVLLTLATEAPPFVEMDRRPLRLCHDHGQESQQAINRQSPCQYGALLRL